jgi:D-alanine-D-alanine ligase
MTDSNTFRALVTALSGLDLKVHHYNGPAALAQNAHHHRDAVVWSIYGGQRSRNRMALVPAVCESLNLAFIGPDAYGRIVAQDKEVAKRLASDCGLLTPPWRVVRGKDQLPLVRGLTMPLVVKPLLEGSSIGIAQGNRVDSAGALAALTDELLSEFSQPVIVEEFVPGREVAYSKIENPTEDFWAFSEIAMRNDPAYFETRLFDADEKQHRSADRIVRNIDAELNKIDKARLDLFLSAFGAYGYCRVDGRLSGGRFHFLELTPDAWIAPAGQFAMSFIDKGWTFQEVIEAVLCSARSSPPDQ